MKIKFIFINFYLKNRIFPFKNDPVNRLIRPIVKLSAVNTNNKRIYRKKIGTETI